MKKLDIKSKLSRTVNRTGLKIKKYSPEILVAAGVVGVITSGVMACKATLKVNEVVEQSKKDIDTIHESAEKGYTPAGLEYSQEDAKKDLTIAYVQTGVKFAKLYGPSVVLGALSITSIVASNHILRKRNVALAAAYTAVDKGFKEYRKRVVERFGKEIDRELRYNIKAKEVEETVMNEDGTDSTEKKVINVMGPNDYSPYSIVFDDGNPGWNKDPEKTKFFLIQQQNWANEKLQSQGHLFLNEVYDMLGAPRTAYGNEVGWIYDENNPIGDNYVDFGLFDIHRQKAREFINGYERVVVLDFNVDGRILDKI